MTTRPGWTQTRTLDALLTSELATAHTLLADAKAKGPMLETLNLVYEAIERCVDYHQQIVDRIT